MRFQTYFGVPVPPWKEKKLGAGAITIRFVITGAIPSKKNNQQAVTVRKDAYKLLNDLVKKKKTLTKADGIALIKACRSKMRGNAAYLKFVEVQTPSIVEQRQYWIDRLQKKGLTFPLTDCVMSMRFYFAQRYRQDSVNKQQSIQDILKELYIIADDDYTCTDPVKAAGKCYYEEITKNICVVLLSFKL